MSAPLQGLVLFFLVVALSLFGVLAFFGLLSLLDQYDDLRHPPAREADPFLASLRVQAEISDLAAAGRAAVLDRVMRARE